MSEIKININGKDVNPSEVTLEQVIESIFGKTYNDIPEEYQTPDDYIVLNGLDLRPQTINTKEKVNDLAKKLKQRLAWINKHKDYNIDNDSIDFLKSIIENIYKSKEMIDNAMNAHNLVLGYINSVLDTTKKK